MKAACTVLNGGDEETGLCRPRLVATQPLPPAWGAAQALLAQAAQTLSLKHYWRFVDSEALELKALSQGVGGKAA